MNAEIFYLAPNGSDGNKGTKTKPFATLQGATAAVADYLNSHPGDSCTVILRDGVYPVSETWTLDGSAFPETAGEIVFAAAKGEHPVISGGRYLSLDDFYPADEAFLSTLRVKPEREILAFDLKQAGIVGWETMQESNGVRYAEFYDGSTRYELPQYPKQDFLHFDEVSENHVYVEKDEIPLSWKSLDGVRAFGYMDADYFSEDSTVTDVGEGKRQLTCNFSSGRSYRYYNVPSELSKPGEYYIDRANGILYVCPDGDFFRTNRMISQFENPLLIAKGISHVTFRDLHFEGCRGSCADVEGDFVTLEGCVFSRIGGNVLHIKGLHNRICFCEAYAIGGAGFTVNGGDTQTMESANTVVDSNHIHHYALNGRTYQAAIIAEGGVGHRISHNHIHHSIHNGINGYCPDLLVEYNIIHDVCREAHDAGAIYTGRWHSRNTVYRYNLIYDNVNINGYGVPFGIYNDDSGAGKRIYGNILCNIAGYGVKIGCGNCNRIYNNLIIDALVSIDDDDRSYYGKFQNKECRMDGFFFHEQIAFPAGGSRSWNTRYAEATLMKYTMVEDTTDRWVYASLGMTEIYGNCLVHTSPVQMCPITDSFTVSRDNVQFSSAEEAGIADKENHNFRFRPDARVYRDMPFWQEIPYDEIGPRPRPVLSLTNH